MILILEGLFCKIYIYIYKYVRNFGCFLRLWGGGQPTLVIPKFVPGNTCMYASVGDAQILHQFSKLGMEKGAFCVSGINSNMKMNRPRLDKSRGIRHLKGCGSNSSPVGKEKKSKGLAV